MYTRNAVHKHLHHLQAFVLFLKQMFPADVWKKKGHLHHFILLYDGLFHLILFLKFFY